MKKQKAEHLANFRKGRRRVDFYVASSVIPYLEFFQNNIRQILSAP